MSDAAKERRDELASLYALGAIDAADYTCLLYTSDAADE